MKSSIPSILIRLVLFGVGCSGPTELTPVESIELTSPKNALTSYEVVQLTLTIRDKNGQPIANRIVKWSSSNTTIARVSATGMVTAGFVLGGSSESVAITAETEGKSGSITLTIGSTLRLHPRWVRDTTWNEGNIGMTLVYESQIAGGPTFLKPWTFKEVTDTNEAVRKGWKAQRFETQGGDCYGTDCNRNPVYERNEFAQAGGENLEGDEYWYAWSFYVPVTFTPAAWVFYGQFIQHHNYDSIWMFMKRAGQPFCAVFDWVRNNNWNCTLKNHILIDDENFAGRWHDILVHAKWTTGESGFTKIYVDDALVVDYKGYTRTQGNEDVYFKYGIYRHQSSANTVIYYDEVRRGSRREDVDLRLMEP